MLLRRAFARRRSRRTLRCAALWRLRGTIRLRTVVRLRRRRTIIPRWRLGRTIVRHWLIRLRPIVRLRSRRTIVPRRRLSRTIVRHRLFTRSGTVRLRGIRPRTIVGSGLIAGAVRRTGARCCHRRHGGTSRRRLPHRRTCRRCTIVVCGLQALHFLARDWLSRMSCQQLLSSCKGHRWRRRFCFCNNRTTSNRSRWCGCSVCRIGMQSQDAVGSWSNCRS